MYEHSLVVEFVSRHSGAIHATGIDSRKDVAAAFDSVVVLVEAFENWRIVVI